MFRLIAPYIGPRVTTVLPNPELNNSSASTAEVTVLHAIDGTRYTFKKDKNGRKHLQWTFYISQEKKLELKEFFRVFFSTKLKIIDHNDEIWIGYFMSNPFTFSDNRRASSPVNEEFTFITLDFEEAE